MRSTLLAFGMLAVMAHSALADACYRRDYSDAHIRQHPNQTVKSLRLQFMTDGDFIAQVAVRFSGDQALYQAEMTCYNPPWIEPGVIACDRVGTFFAKGYDTDQMLIFTHGGFNVRAASRPEPRGVIDDDAIEGRFKLARRDMADCDLRP